MITKNNWLSTELFVQLVVRETRPQSQTQRRR